MAVITRIILVVFVALSADCAQAQFGVSFSRQDGRVTGGSLQVSGVITGGGRYVRMGVNASANQLIGIQNFPFYAGAFGNTGFGNGGNNGFGNAGFGNGGFGGGGFQGTGNAQANSSGPKPTVAQFVKAAIAFDADKNGELDEEELGAVAAAILAELRQRGNRKPAASPSTEKKDTEPDPAQKKLIDTFVKRSMKFDSNKDKSLNKEETKKLAIVFIKSMT